MVRSVVCRAHFVGVAGVGMSAVAQAAGHVGWKVTGSDRYLDSGDDLPVLQTLRSAGIELVPQDGVAAAGADVVVVSTAIESDNPDLVAAGRHSIAVMHRSEMLQRLCEGKRLYAVSGTSGKSTVTAMLGCVLEALGQDPFVINGAPVLNWMGSDRVGNVRAGAGPAVIEADESDKSLVNFSPTAAIVTNISSDHFPEAEARELFHRFAARCSGPVIGALGTPVEPTDLKMLGREGCTFRYRGVPVRLRVGGAHNAQNACRTLELCEALAFDIDACAQGLSSFLGVHRRLERVGETGGVAVVDDYGHNPAKIRAAWESVAAWAEPVIGVWRPHGYGPLRTMLEALVETFSTIIRAGDHLVLLPVYDAGGTALRSIRSEDLAEALQARGCSVSVSQDYPAVVEAVRRRRAAGGCALVMGARDPHLPELCRMLLSAAGESQNR